ncbi:hypothetical protein AB0G04_13340 [Actinoplanes sp. NPDC023801]|uniref:hypothetical protein n=1 Tax=Actinoplanes sp. NPDC023801 TaxID=3154595 RepID=UPI0033C31545
MVVTSRESEPGSPHRKPSRPAEPAPGRSWRRGEFPDPAALDVRATMLSLRATTPRHRLTVLGLRAAAMGLRVVAVGRSPVALGRMVRKPSVVGVAIAAASLGGVVVWTAGSSAETPEFRPPAAVTVPPAVTPSATATAKTGLAPYVPPAATGNRLVPGPRASMPGARTGSRSSAPATTSRARKVLPGTRSRPAGTAPARPVKRSTARLRGAGMPEKAATISIGQPGDGETVSSSATVTGTVDMPDGHQVWLLRRQGAGGAHHVVGVCRGARSFVCGPAGLESGGDETFQLTVIVVDPATAAALTAGTTRDSLPANVARSEVTVRRAAA